MPSPPNFQIPRLNNRFKPIGISLLVLKPQYPRCSQRRVRQVILSFGPKSGEEIFAEPLIAFSY